MHCREDAEIWYVDCSHKYKMNQGVMVGGKRPLVEDDLCWKMTFGGRRPFAEDDLRRKTTCGRRRPSVEDNLWWKTTYGGRQPSVEDNFWRKTILACCLVRFAAFFILQSLLRVQKLSSIQKKTIFLA